MIIAIDPGPTQSGYCLHDVGGPRETEVMENNELLDWLGIVTGIDVIAIESIESYGMAVGRETFETCIWIGRFGQRFGWERVRLIPRKDVKISLCGTMKAKDANIRQALIDRYGGKEKAIGSKRFPGPLYGIKSHGWSALAIAETAYEMAA